MVVLAHLRLRYWLATWAEHLRAWAAGREPRPTCLACGSTRVADSADGPDVFCGRCREDPPDPYRYR